MRVEDLRNAVADANQTYHHESSAINELADGMATILDTYGSRRLNGWGYFDIAFFPLAIPLNLMLSYPMAEQSPLSRMTKRILKTRVELKDESVEVLFSSSIGNPRKPGKLSMEVDNISRLDIETATSTHSRGISLFSFNPRFRSAWSWTNSEKWIEGRKPSLDEINAHAQIVEVVSQSMSARVPQTVPSHYY